MHSLRCWGSFMLRLPVVLRKITVKGSKYNAGAILFRGNIYYWVALWSLLQLSQTVSVFYNWIGVELINLYEFKNFPDSIKLPILTVFLYREICLYVGLFKIAWDHLTFCSEFLGVWMKKVYPYSVIRVYLISLNAADSRKW